MKKCLIFFGLILALEIGVKAASETPLFGPPVYVSVFADKGMAFSLAPDPRPGFSDLMVLNPSAAEAGLFQGVDKGKAIWKDFRAVKNKRLKGARTIEMVDVNGDGQMDLLILGGGNLSVLLGDSFTKAFSIPQVRLATGFLTGDLNHDGILDLIVASSDRSLYVLMGKEKGGSFSPPIRIPLEGTPENMVIGEFNGDRFPDIGVLMQKSGENVLTLLFGDGKGGFKNEGNPHFSVPGDSYDLIATDLNKDGLSDLVTSSSLKHSLIFLMGNKDGFWKLTSFTSPLLETTRGLAAGDFHLTGNIDIALTSSGIKEDSLVLIKNDGSGNFTLATKEVFSLGSDGRVPAGQNPLVAMDVDHDGNLDLVVATDRNKVIVMKNNLGR